MVGKGFTKPETEKIKFGYSKERNEYNVNKKGNIVIYRIHT